MTKKRKRTGLLVFQLLIVIGVLVLLWSSFGQSVLAPHEHGPAPATLGDLELVSIVEGADALTQVSQLHGNVIPLVSAYIARYAGESGQVTVWAGQAGTEKDAAELNTRMVEAIAKGGSPFRNPRPLSIAGHEVFKVDSSSSSHFFYQSHRDRKSVIWLEIKASDSLSILEQAVTTF